LKLSRLLKARALRYRGFYDLAAFHAEQAVQLYLKGVLARLGLEDRRTHEVRELFSDLFMNLTYLERPGGGGGRLRQVAEAAAR